MTDTDKYGWRSATQDEIEALTKEMDLLKIFHSVAYTSLWYRRVEAETCKSYMEIPAYARREELYNADKPGQGYEIHQINLVRWRRIT